MRSQSLCNPLFVNTIVLGGTPQQKIAAARAAGFDQVELWRQDVESCDCDPQAFGSWIREQSVTITDYQVIFNFDGAPDAIRDRKRAEALHMLDTAVKLGASTVLTPASTDPGCVAGRVEQDMRWLAREAASRNLRIAYENLAWSAVNFTLPAVWEVVERVNEPNLGVAVDSFHIFARRRDAGDLAGIPIDRIFLVQLSDFDRVELFDPDDAGYRESVINLARHYRLMPGQGRFPMETVLGPLREANYSGPIGVEVFSDSMEAQDPQVIAREAMSALKSVWLR
jgi:4-hydroxyphenylpyruvate dioxygenase